VLRWLARCSALAAVLGCGQDPAQPDIVLISVDTVRADHLDAWGYSRRTAPALTALANQGVRFEQAISASSRTLPSMATLHTSLYPTEHGAVGANRQLAEDHLTLAEALRRAGYDTTRGTGRDARSMSIPAVSDLCTTCQSSAMSCRASSITARIGNGRSER
jgi:hypothetical protein